MDYYSDDSEEETYFEPERVPTRGFARGHRYEFGPNHAYGQVRGRGRGCERGQMSEHARGSQRGFNPGRASREARYNDSPQSFRTSEDGTTFYFPFWKFIDKDPTLMETFSSSLKCVGGYSVDEASNFSYDQTCMSFLNLKYLPERQTKKKVFLDLTVGERKAIHYSGSPIQSFDNFLSWILSNEEKFIEELGLHNTAAERRSGGNFVFLKNVLSVLISASYVKVDITIHAVCGYALDGCCPQFQNLNPCCSIDGLIYILRDRDDSETKFPNAQRIEIWGHKYKQYLTFNQHTDKSVNSNLGYRCVLSSKLGSHNLFYSSSIDCVHPDKYDPDMPDLSSCVSLKSVFDNPMNLQTNSLQRYKMLNWCNELVLTGTPELVAGYRDEEGLVDYIQLYTKEDLMAEGKGYWEFDAFSVFVLNFLSFVQRRVESRPGKIFKFVKDEGDTCFESYEEQTYKDFPPSWFLEGFRQPDPERRL